MSRFQQITLFLGLYAAQGMPYGFFSVALPALMRESGVSLLSIGLLQFLALPWALKFMWAPVVDHHGSRRGWILALQGTACALALGLSQLDVHTGTLLLFVAIFGFNLLAATQDIVTDGLAVRLLSARERGLANALQVGAYRVGMILGGGLLLWVFARSNWQVMFVCMAGLLALSTLPALRLKESHLQNLPPSIHTGSAVASASTALPPPPRPQGWHLALGWLQRALRPGMLPLAGLLFAYRLGDHMVSSLITPFVVDQGHGKEVVALMKGVVGSGTSLLGAALGGWLMMRTGRRKAVLWFGLTQAAGFGLLIAASMGLGGQGPDGRNLLWAAVVVEGVLGSMATVALYALMMDACDPDHAGTDYTLLASVAVVGDGLGGMVGGALGDALGYTWAFGTGTTLCALGCVSLVRWLDGHPVHARVVQAWRPPNAA